MSEPTERVFIEWLTDGPDHGPEDALHRALAATRRTAQRPGWTIPERWLPMQLTMHRVDVRPPITRLALVALLALALVAVALVVGSQRRLPPPFGPARNGLIAYDTAAGIYLVNADGSGTELAFGGLGREYTPTFSPDGTKIAFWSRADEDGSLRLLVADATADATPTVVSGDIAPITSNINRAPAWSPDGTRLAFSADDQGVQRLFIAKADGSGVTPISDRSDDRSYPTWSPDGTWLAYQRLPRNGGRPGLAIVMADGNGERVLTRSLGTFNTAWDFGPSRWSADSTRLAYFRFADGKFVLGVVDLQGRQTLVPDPNDKIFTMAIPFDRLSFAFSPDGRSVAFVAEPDGVVVVGADGAGAHIVSPTSADCGLGWSPDGTRILVTHCVEGFESIPTDGVGPTLRIPFASDRSYGTPSWQRLAP